MIHQVLFNEESMESKIHNWHILLLKPLFILFIPYYVESFTSMKNCLKMCLHLWDIPHITCRFCVVIVMLNLYFKMISEPIQNLIEHLLSNHSGHILNVYSKTWQHII
jgi:hypothetical protein